MGLVKIQKESKKKKENSTYLLERSEIRTGQNIERKQGSKSTHTLDKIEVRTN